MFSPIPEHEMRLKNSASLPPRRVICTFMSFDLVFSSACDSQAGELGSKIFLLEKQGLNLVHHNCGHSFT